MRDYGVKNSNAQLLSSHLFGIQVNIHSELENI